jgi:hypothetical protein
MEMNIKRANAMLKGQLIFIILFFYFSNLFFLLAVVYKNVIF